MGCQVLVDVDDLYKPTIYRFVGLASKDLQSGEYLYSSWQVITTQYFVNFEKFRYLVSKQKLKNMERAHYQEVERNLRKKVLRKERFRNFRKKYLFFIPKKEVVIVEKVVYRYPWWRR